MNASAFMQRQSARPREWWIKRGLMTLLALIILFYPSIFADSPSAFQDSQWMPQLTTMVPVLVFVIMALGLNVVVGYAGLLDLGYVAFYAAGAYVAGWFGSQQFAPHNVHLGAIDVPASQPGIHISPWLLILVGAAFAALLGIVIGVPTLRLRGDYLAIVTLGFGEIIPQVVRNGNSFFGFNLTNGPAGLTGLDPMGFGATIHGWFPFIPVDFTIQYNPDKFFYWSLVVMLAFTLFTMIRLRDSRLGRAWVAIREDEDAAAAMGIPLMRTKTYAYAIGAFFGGGAGCIFAFYKGATFPNDFYLNISIFILCMVILGGMGNVWGVCVGAVLLSYLNFQGLNAIGNTFNDVTGQNVNVPEYQYLVYGTIIVLVMLYRPQGLIPSAQRKAELEFEQDDAAAEAAG
jgi:branched-chain amino acid transport system permease protein